MQRDDHDAAAAAPLLAPSPRATGSGDAATSAPAPTDNDDRPVDWRATGLCFAIPALAGALFGADIGGTSSAVLSLTGPASGADWAGPALTPLQSGAVVSASLFGALLASAATLAAGDRLGRRAELAAAGVLYAVGAAGAALAPSYAALVASRGLYGLGIGLAMHGAPAYIAETSPAAVRGLLISLKEAAIVAGILLGYLAGAAFVADGVGSGGDAGGMGAWRLVYACAAMPGVALALGATLLIPESPRFLLLSGAGREQAAQALRRAEGKRASKPEDVERELMAVEDALAEARDAEAREAALAARGGGPSSSSSSSLWFLQPRYGRPLTVGLSLVALQQLTGQPSVLYYAASIFNAAGFEGGDGARVAVGLGAFKLLMTLAAVALVDRAGRRPLLLGGVSGMTAALALLSAAQGGVFSPSASSSASGAAGAAVAAAASSSDPAAIVSVAALLLYVGCYQLSFGPISWLLVGELFPLGRRGQAIAAAVLTNFGVNALVSLALPQAQAALGPAKTYAAFCAVGVFAVLLINAIVPETRGKTLEEIEALWLDKKEAGSGNA
jgi:sugar porter (SP) family MFS transporter